ncbi:cholesterol oxidase substrate-binding domain-containing protein [Streptomyces sp. NPDC020096]
MDPVRDAAPTNPDPPAGPSRRTLLAAAAGAAVVATTGWTPLFRLTAEAATLSPPPDFPPGIALAQQAFSNWSEQIVLDQVWTAVPATPADVVALANWALAHGYQLRALGQGHNWAPFLASDGQDVSHTLLVDTKPKLTAISVHPGNPGSVTAQTGATLDAVHAALERGGLGFAAIPAPGDLTVGGALAIGAHGTGLPVSGEQPPAGSDFGTLSNLVLSLTAVVWDPGSARYLLRTFQRGDPDIGAFLVHLGRAFVTEVTLQVPVNTRMRCQNWFDIQVADLFGAPGSSSANLDQYLSATGRVEAIWFPFTTIPWLKVWSVAPNKPWFSAELDAPYPYTFANQVSQAVSDQIKQILQGDGGLTPTFTNSEMATAGSGMIALGIWDIWGWSKNVMLYVQPTTLRIFEGGWAVLCARADVQRVVHDFYVAYQAQVTAAQNAGQYPVNCPVELRITGVDTPAAVGGGAQALLSPARARPDHPEWDTVVWLDFATYPGTPYSAAFFAELDQWILSHYTGWSMVRPEWSKGWAHTASGGPWTNSTVIGTTWPEAFRAGLPTGAQWNDAVATLHRYDPAAVFSSPFLKQLLGA